MTDAATPDYIAQTAEPMTQDERFEWMRARTKEATAEGMTHGRFTLHPTIPNLLLVEAWKERPADEGEPRWQMGPTT